MRTTIPTPFDSLINDPGSLPRLAREFRAASGGLQDVSPDGHKLYERLCDSVEALSPYAPLDFSLKNGLCYAIKAFLVRLGEVKGARSPGATKWSFCLGSERIEAKSDPDEKELLMEDQELREKLEYMDALLVAYEERPTSKRYTLEIPKLVTSKAIIGHGSHGTTVYEGHLGTQRVAVKRMLKHFYSVPQRELKLVREARNHPNVLRYHHFTEDFDFVFIAMERCPMTLAEVVRYPQRHADVAAFFRPKDVLQQIASGLQHLHEAGIVHGNIHPRNVLVSERTLSNGKASYRMVLSDYALHVQLTIGEVYERMSCVDSRDERGWLAPELLRGEVALSERPQCEDARTQAGPIASLDIFALGCVFYYVLMEGGHPFGGCFERESNIINNLPCIQGLHSLEDGHHAQLLVSQMLDSDAQARPNVVQCLMHPYFLAFD